MSWRDLIEKHEGWSWDEVVECSDDITQEQRRVVATLGYYGYPVRPADAEHLEAGRERPSAAYEVTCHAVDGNSVHGFETEAEALEWVLARAQWWTSPTAGHSDFAHFYCRGFENPEWKRMQA